MLTDKRPREKPYHFPDFFKITIEFEPTDENSSKTTFKIKTLYGGLVELDRENVVPCFVLSAISNFIAQYLNFRGKRPKIQVFPLKKFKNYIFKVYCQIRMIDNFIAHLLICIIPYVDR
jgi:hypothetical protein